MWNTISQFSKMISFSQTYEKNQRHLNPLSLSVKHKSSLVLMGNSRGRWGFHLLVKGLSSPFLPMQQDCSMKLSSIPKVVSAAHSSLEVHHRNHLTQCPPRGHYWRQLCMSKGVQEVSLLISFTGHFLICLVFKRRNVLTLVRVPLWKQDQATNWKTRV